MHEYPRETQGKPVERDIWQGCNILAPKEGGSKRYARQLPFISKPVTQHLSFLGKNFSFILISSEYSSLVKTSN